MKMLQPFLIGQLIAYFSPSSVMSDTEAYLYGVCLSVTAMLQVFCNPFYFYIMARVAMRMRAAMSGLIYRKILDMNSKSFSQTTSGKIVNLLSTDVEKFTLSVPHVHYLWICPVNITVSAYCMYRLVGVSCMFGFALAAVLLLAQTIAGHAYGKLRIQVGKWSDKRVHVMTELLAGIRVVKMYCWEAPFSWLINALRDKEVRVLKWSFVLRSLSIYSAEAASRMMALAIFVGHWLCGYPPISLRNVFIVNGLLQVMNFSVFYFFYAAVESLTELLSSLKRIKNFLSIEIEPPSPNHMTPESDGDGGWSIQTTNMSACWDYTNEAPEEGKLLLDTEIDAGASFSLKDLTLTIQKGELVAVVGTVGAGKTSLLAALMGDLPSSHGHISIRGSVGYFSQQPWVFSGTVRDNIVFGDEFDSKRYENVIQACALTRDLSMMSHGDQTLVGERGLLLSGGQKARITLARSVYRDDDVYLLDDPLSAVDPKVGKHIFHSCICDVLQSKTRVLVTHQLQYLKFVDRIVVMSEGQILDIGNYDELLSRDLDLSVIMSVMTDEPNDPDVPYSNDKDEKIKFKLSDTAEELEEEQRGTGSIGLHLYLQYFKAGHGVILLPLITLLCATYQSMYAFSDWMLAQWSEDSYLAYMVDVNMSSNSSVNLNSSLATRHWNTMEPEVKKYILSVVAYVFVMLVYGILVFQMTVLASQNLHNKMFRFILGSRTRFFDENPVGRILNRFARDIGLIDTSYGTHFSTIVEQFFQLLVLLSITLIVSPWLLIPIAPLLVFLVCIRYYAVQTTRDIRRLEGIAQSPVFSHVSDTINGLQTIRAMGKQEQVYTTFASFQNTHTSAWFLYISAYRWFSMRSSFSLALYTIIVIAVCIALGNNIPRVLLALSLSYCSAIPEPFEYFMRTSAEIENIMTSVERIVSYTTLEQEGPVTTATPPPPTWPSSGCITFTDVCLRYTATGAMVLKHLNIHIEAREKIGIVGRTGAGKSSLLAALLRLAEPEGAIIIDDINITDIGLHELRHKLSVIPQDPFLFSGDLRRNLDPFQEFPDSLIWDALHQVQLGDKVTSSPGQLDMEVAEAGGNFSVGEKQLICLARALLRRNTILILDEATANVDHKTDELIQRTIRDQFQRCTVLTIAHRLHTVVDYDRVIVLDEGEIKEFDTPYTLLKNEGGFLYQLVSQMGTEHKQELLAIAKRAFKSR
ncbi:ATP-binding cassette sub-family C member 4-like [Haliotis rufescens]|uniref:ATP-binding cassette sub-family C member 4-like n=1 Tax=Haliotis rufescens TaxID=6454 RepID=UPI00201EF7FA|nr:ATP-binding cassette sub-family C member 4-like [Haliotis rufescens]